MNSRGTSRASRASRGTRPGPTHRRLLLVAIDHFGRRGLEGASTRAIARDARTLMSSITYHFGGKEALYLAAADYIADTMRARLEGVAATLEGRSAQTPPAARAALHRIAARMIEVLVSRETARFARFIVREQADPTEAFRRIYAKTMGPVLSGVARLVRAVSNRRLTEREAKLCAITLVGQILAFRVARAAVLTVTGWREIGARETREIKRVVAENLDAILDRIEAAAAGVGTRT